MKEKAGRNRTLFLTETDKRQLSSKITTLYRKAEKAEITNKTVNQDLLKIASLLPANFVDLLIVDPPYNLSKSFGHNNFQKMSAEQYESYTRDWLEKIIHTLKPNASVYVCADWESSFVIYKVLREFFTVRNRITWEREKGRGAKSNWKNCAEDIWFCTVSNDYYFDAEAVKLKRKVVAPYRENGRPKDWNETADGNFRLTAASNLWTDLTVPFWSMPENTAHPTQKPEKLIAKLILASSKPNDFVFDPFAGSGTTSVAAHKLDREFLGIEINTEYALLTQKRLELTEHNRTIQGFADGFFWERNTLAMQKKNQSVAAVNNNRKGLFQENTMLESFIEFIKNNRAVNDKSELAALVKNEFALTKDRSVFYNSQFAVRFSQADSTNFGNTVLSLSRLQKYDDKPFIVCLVLPRQNVLLLANSTFLKKISHSSQALRTDNIKGSFNGSDITREFDEIANSPENFDELFEIHKQISFAENLARLVEATNGIAPSGKRFEVLPEHKTEILNAPLRAEKFSASNEYEQLKNELDELVKRFENEILIASLIENVKVRGGIIEYLIAGKNDALKQNLIAALQNKTDVPAFKIKNELGDYVRNFGDVYHTATDIKTKIMVLDSNPKAYNLDKMLEFLASKNSVFMFYFVGINFDDKTLNPVLVSMFHAKILTNTIFQKHWAGRNSRGVSQLNGKKIKELFAGITPTDISVEKSQQFLSNLIEL